MRLGWWVRKGAGKIEQNDVEKKCSILNPHIFQASMFLPHPKTCFPSSFTFSAAADCIPWDRVVRKLNVGELYKLLECMRILLYNAFFLFQSECRNHILSTQSGKKIIFTGTYLIKKYKSIKYSFSLAEFPSPYEQHLFTPHRAVGFTYP